MPLLLLFPVIRIKFWTIIVSIFFGISFVFHGQELLDHRILLEIVLRIICIGASDTIILMALFNVIGTFKAGVLLIIYNFDHGGGVAAGGAVPLIPLTILLGVFIDGNVLLVGTTIAILFVLECRVSCVFVIERLFLFNSGEAGADRSFRFRQII